MRDHVLNRRMCSNESGILIGFVVVRNLMTRSRLCIQIRVIRLLAYSHVVPINLNPRVGSTLTSTCMHHSRRTYIKRIYPQFQLQDARLRFLSCSLLSLFSRSIYHGHYSITSTYLVNTSNSCHDIRAACGHLLRVCLHACLPPEHLFLLVSGNVDLATFFYSRPFLSLCS